MKLTFNKVGKKYISEFEVTSDFNIHIERPEGGIINIYQRTSSEGEYAIVDKFDTNGKSVIDVDFTALIYPKWIKIVSEKEPTIAEVNETKEPEEPIFIEHHFEFNNLVESEDGYSMFETVFEETQYDDYSHLYNSLVSFLKEHGENYEDSQWYIYDAEIMSKYTNITLNEYNVTAIYYYAEWNNIEFESDGPCGIHNCTGASLYEDRVRYYTL